MIDPHPQRWTRAFDACKRDAERLVRDLSPSAFNKPPSEGAWSAGQCLDHLLEAGQPLAPRLREALEAAPAASGPPHLRWYDRLFVWSVQPDHWLKIPAPGAYAPSPSSEPDRTVAEFGALQDAFGACAEAATGRDWSAVRAASPASRFVRLSVGGWLEGTLAHQRRHLRQARRAVVA